MPAPGGRRAAHRGARDYARQLLADLADGLPSPSRERAAAMDRRVGVIDEHPAVTWAQSGLMALTGPADGEPCMCPVPLAACADGVLAALATLTGADFEGARGSQLLAARAAIAGHSRQGRTAPGGSCRLLEASDGTIALNLPRADDWELLPAWLETGGSGFNHDPGDWERVAAQVRKRPAADLVGRGRLMGLAVAASEQPGPASRKWFEPAPLHPPRRRGRPARPRVIDLSSLWAGPLCTQLLRQCGAEVVKVESANRPDGARNGPRAFFDLLNAGKASVALDLGTSAGRAQLHDLLRSADIVVEGSRPRALRQLGIDAHALVREQPGLTWISITGYGRGDPVENWVAFGDDAGVAAGLSEVMRAATGEALVVGDAIADPLTGLHAALAGWASWNRGGGNLISLSLRDVVRHCINFDLPDAGLLARRHREWTDLAGAAMRPAAPPVLELARSPGADNAAILRDSLENRVG